MSSSVQLFEAIGAQLSAALGCRADAAPSGHVQGGCINESYRWRTAGGWLFVKVTEVAQRSMLEAEAEGLAELASAAAVRVPHVLAMGVAEEHAFLALEWIDLRGSSSGASQARLGNELAQQHRKTSEQFGWHRDDTIGSTPQMNAWASSWVDFFRDARLGYQLRLAQENGFGGGLQEQGAVLLEQMGELFTHHEPAPSLLHGDLWGGNAGVDAHGTPVIFDPAVYYGDREADLAMTRLFGGFSPSFYSAYEAAWPLPASAHTRVDLYNLYHVLNHLNLFGGGYLRQAESIIARLLAARR